MGQEKIKTLDELPQIVSELKNQGKKIVHCHGCFDIVHYGHLRHFLNAKEQGDILIITITPDKFIQKGPGRPFFNEEMRMRHLSSLECIDYIALNKWETAIETIKLLKPDVYSKGKEVLGNAAIDEIKTSSGNKSNLSLEIETLEAQGGKFHLTDEISFSSSKIINQSLPCLVSEESRDFLNNFKNKFKPEQIIEILESLKDLKVLVIGDAILDEYVFCNLLDKVGKEPMVAYKFLNSETYLGGSFAVAENLTSFTNNVNLITCIGDKSYEFIETNLNKNIERNIFIQKDSQTIIKRRYIDDYKKIKLFEVYNTEDLKINQETEEKIMKYLDENLSRFDLIIVSDFGHGLITPKILDFLCNCNKFLAVNCQLNAGNFGYNFITKYKKADFISLNDKELRLPFQEKTSNIKIPITKLSQKLNLNKINISLGKSGSVYYNENKFYFVPAFTEDPLDTVGAGDAVLSLTSLLAFRNTNPSAVPFLGNCIGALAVKIMGNKRQVTLTELKKFINYIMK